MLEWEIIIGIIAGVFIAGGSVKGAQMIEDHNTTSDDSFVRWDQLLQQYGGENWPLLKAIAMNESQLGRYPSVARGLEYPNDVEGSKSDDGLSWGLMQITLATGRDFDPLVTPEKLNNPEYSISMAARLIRSLQKQFPQEEYVVKAYNQGAGNTRKEISGSINGYAEQYWERFQRNRQLIRDKQGV